MATTTANFGFLLPAVNDPIDANVWGGFLNTNWTDTDSYLSTRTINYDFDGFQTTNAGLRNIAEKKQAVSLASNTATFSLADGNIIDITLDDDLTTWSITVPAYTSSRLANEFRYMVLKLTQDGTGGHTVTFPSAFDFGDAGAPTVSTTASETTLLVAYTFDDGTNWAVAQFGQGGFTL